mmetsp:Transcript_22267/g.29288  ORF Transcript_22267/g.29288 Transcript_22267/m.29288 type:complete len:369 (-) Transcript_22267:80-1186(-)
MPMISLSSSSSCWRIMRFFMTIIASTLLPLTVVQGLASSSSSSKPSSPQQAPQLAGKRAFVTGSSGGIGAGIAKKLAKEGAHVLLHYHVRKEGAIATRDAIVREGGSCVGIVQCDFRSPQAIDHLFHTVLDTQICWPSSSEQDDDDDDEEPSGTLDILINNAGIVSKLAMEDDTPHLDTWHETLQVNLHAPLQISRLAHARMKHKKKRHHHHSRDRGVIVNVSSIHGTQSVEYMVAYATSKAALDSLTRGLALEYAPDHIRVNAIAPGVVPVERTQSYFADPHTQHLWTPHLPTNRVGTIEEIADATLPLITNEWITGTIWTIDGGMLARSNMPIRPRPDAPVTPSTEEEGDDDKEEEEELPQQAYLL